MASIETARTWTFTSTGTGKAHNCKGYPARVTLGYETSAGCTGAVALEHRMGSSAGPYSVLSSQTLSSGVFTTDQFPGPYEWLRPRVPDKTSGSTHVFTVYLLGN